MVLCAFNSRTQEASLGSCVPARAATLRSCLCQSSTQLYDVRYNTELDKQTKKAIPRLNRKGGSHLQIILPSSSFTPEIPTSPTYLTLMSALRGSYLMWQTLYISSATHGSCWSLYSIPLAYYSCAVNYSLIQIKC